jgi:hypothetical protein
MRNFHLMRLLAALACLLAASCFDIREELWVAPDGSGRAELRYTAPESALLLLGGRAGLEKKIRELVATQPTLRLDAVEIRSEDDEVTLTVGISTESMLSLLELRESEEFKTLPSAGAEIAGHFDVRPRGPGVDFTRTIRPREALGLAALAVGREDRATRRLTYIVHLPVAAREHNADRIEDGGRTLVWDRTLGSALKAPVVTHFHATLPIPWWGWAILGALVLLLVLAGRWLWRRLARLRRRSGSIGAPQAEG